ncbi:MAG: hypothetical protein WC205_04280 [Opitutaceae bacterium]|jgi:hypothetical protein
MSNPGHSRPGALRLQLTTLPDGRLHAVTSFKLSHGEEIRSDLILPWGGLYSAIEKIKCTGKQAHLAGLRLIGGQEARQMQGGGDWVWVREYEELPETAEVQAGKNRRRIGDDGRVEIVADFIQLSSAARTPGTVAVTTAPAPDAAEAVMASEDPVDAGAVRRIQRVYVAAGLLATSERVRGGGLKEVTWTSVRTKQTPAGVVIADATEKPNGIPVFTVRAIQGADGGSPEAVTYSYAEQRRWRAPGRVKAQVITKAISSPGSIPSVFDFKTLTLNKSAPVVFEGLDVTVSITYQSSAEPGSVAPVIWDPQQWSTADWDYILRGPRPVRRVQDYPEYCVDDASGVSAVSVTTPADTGGFYIAGEGELLYKGGNTHKLTITGPVYPAGEARTIEPVRVEPDFEALDGTKWYKRIQVSATLPILPAMPTLST